MNYYNVGKLLNESGKHYGEGIINRYSIKLIKEFDKKYNITIYRCKKARYNFLTFLL